MIGLAAVVAAFHKVSTEPGGQAHSGGLPPGALNIGPLSDPARAGPDSDTARSPRWRRVAPEPVSGHGALTKSKTRVTVRFQPQADAATAAVFDLGLCRRTVRGQDTADGQGEIG